MPDPVTPAPNTPPAAPAPVTPPATPPATPPIAPQSTPSTPNTPPATPPAAPAAGTPPPEAPANVPGQSAEVVYALTLPENSVLDPAAVERVTALAKEAKLAPETAQKVMDLAHAEASSFLEQQKADYSEKITGWENAVNADPELGGANRLRTDKRAKEVFDRFADQELVAALKSTGFGNYPPLVRLINKIGAAMESDSFTKPGTPAGGEKPISEILWPGGGVQNAGA